MQRQKFRRIDVTCPFTNQDQNQAFFKPEAESKTLLF